MKRMKFTPITIAIAAALAGTLFTAGCSEKDVNSAPSAGIATICNPIDLSYRFQLDEPSRREAADPSVVMFENEYYLFISKSGGYFHSNDLVHWELIETDDLPLESYAPTAEVVDGEILFIASDGTGSSKIWKTSDPKSGEWIVANGDMPFATTDPMLYLDDDGRLYYFWGCSDKEPIYGLELDRTTLKPIGERIALLSENRAVYGWEVPGDHNETPQNAPWIEGPWVNKYKGKYYLQYAGPGTQFKSYNDAVYISDSPLGPYTLAEHNPFAYKPGGFATGAGHGSTFQDRYGNWWHVGTVSISVRHMFERRVSLFPVFFDDNDRMWACTAFGDWPMVIPDRKISSPDELFPGWMLLSYGKAHAVSSTLDGYPASGATDEDIRTWWSARTGDEGEFYSVDLGAVNRVHALQVNFADQDAALFGRSPDIRYRYIIEYSTDGITWSGLVDRSEGTEDSPHDYILLPEPIDARFVRITNVQSPSGKFSLYDFRLFGKGDVAAAAETAGLKVHRGDDRRVATLEWEAVPGATGYNVRFGTGEDMLYQNWMVFGRSALTIRSLNAREPYYFAVDSFNEAGITRGATVIRVE